MNKTSHKIIKAFKILLNDYPYNDITVNMIVEKCDINRNTFYYHFENIESLLFEISEDVINRIISKYFSFESSADCIIPLIKYMESHKKSILHIYNSAERSTCIHGIEDLCYYSVNKYIDRLCEDMTIDKDDRRILIRFYSSALMGILVEWLDFNMDYDMLSAVKRLDSIFNRNAKEIFSKINQNSNSIWKK